MSPVPISRVQVLRIPWYGSSCIATHQNLSPSAREPREAANDPPRGQHSRGASWEPPMHDFFGNTSCLSCHQTETTFIHDRASGKRVRHFCLESENNVIVLHSRTDVAAEFQTGALLGWQSPGCINLAGTTRFPRPQNSSVHSVHSILTMKQSMRHTVLTRRLPRGLGDRPGVGPAHRRPGKFIGGSGSLN